MVLFRIRFVQEESLGVMEVLSRFGLEFLGGDRIVGLAPQSRVRQKQAGFRRGSDPVTLCGEQGPPLFVFTSSIFRPIRLRGGAVIRRHALHIERFPPGNKPDRRVIGAWLDDEHNARKRAPAKFPIPSPSHTHTHIHKSSTAKYTEICLSGFHQQRNVSKGTSEREVMGDFWPHPGQVLHSLY